MSLRLEKSFPSWGYDLASDYYPDESGLGRFVATDKGDFIGREAYRRHLGDGPRERIATFVIDADDADAYTGEPVYCDGQLAGYLTSGGYGYRVEESLALGYLEPEFHDPDRQFSVELLGVRRDATLATGAVYDPRGERMRA